MLSAASSTGKRKPSRELSPPHLAHRPKKLKLGTSSSHNTVAPDLESVIDSSPYPFLHWRPSPQGSGPEIHAISAPLRNQLVADVSDQLLDELDDTAVNVMEFNSADGTPFTSSPHPLPHIDPPHTLTRTPTKLLAHFRMRVPSQRLLNAQRILSLPGKIIRLTEAEGACIHCLAKGLECVTAPWRKQCAFCTSMSGGKYVCTSPPLTQPPEDGPPTNLLAYLANRNPSVHLGVAERVLSDPKRLVLGEEATCGHCVKKGLDCVIAPGRKKCAYCASMESIHYVCPAGTSMVPQGEKRGEDEEEDEREEPEEEQEEAPAPTPTHLHDYLLARIPCPDVSAAEGLLSHPQRVVRLTEAEGACQNCLVRDVECVTVPAGSRCVLCTSIGSDGYTCRSSAPGRVRCAFPVAEEMKWGDGESDEEEEGQLPRPIPTKLVACLSIRQPSTDLAGDGDSSDGSEMEIGEEEEDESPTPTPTNSLTHFSPRQPTPDLRTGEGEEEEEEQLPGPIPTKLRAYFAKRQPSADLDRGQRFLSDPERVVRLTAAEGACPTCVRKGVECVTAPGRRRCAFCASVGGMRLKCGVGDPKGAKERKEEGGEEEEEKGVERPAAPAPIPTNLLAYFSQRATCTNLRTAERIARDPRRVVRVGTAESACTKCVAKGVECVTAPGRKRCAFCTSRAGRDNTCVVGTLMREEEEEEVPAPNLLAYFRQRAATGNMYTAERILKHPQRVVRVGEAEGACKRCVLQGLECVTGPGGRRCALCASLGRGADTCFGVGEGVGGDGEGRRKEGGKEERKCEGEE
ncbi:hypothetical protein MMC30_004715 [Trapelia coarctata]|nr:hypothetical protein [Trapelia coarctata]